MNEKDNNTCLTCDGKGWYAQSNCSSLPWESEQVKCENCSGSGQILDQYGNPTDGSRLINCCFPDCGCDSARLCMAENGPNNCSRSLNREQGQTDLE